MKSNGEVKGERSECGEIEKSDNGVMSSKSSPTSSTVKGWVEFLRFWKHRIAIFFWSWEQPMKLRMMEIGAQIIFALIGVGPLKGVEEKINRELQKAKQQKEENSDSSEKIEAAAMTERGESSVKIRRWLWDLIHLIIAKPARYASDIGVHSRDVQVKECSVRIFQPSAGRIHQLKSNPHFTCLRSILFFHGGGFCLNSASTMTHHVFCERIASEGFVIFSVDYRLAPEFPFPAALTDCYEALLWLTSGGAKPYVPATLNNKEIILAGDSAGGNFVAVLSSLCRDKLDISLQPTSAYDGVRILHQVVAYGALFHHPMLPSMIALLEGKQFPFLSRDAIHWFLDAYTGGNPEGHVEDRRCAPMLAGCHNLPPTTVFTADDPLKDDNLMYVEKLRKSGVKCSHYHYENVHGYLTFEFLDDAESAIINLLDDLAPLTHTFP